MSSYFFTSDTSESIRKKVRIFVVLIIFLFLCLLVRAWHLQILKEESFKQLSKSNRVRLVSLPFHRGIIKDRNGHILVTVRPSFNLYITPEDTTNLKGTLKRLREIIPFDVKQIKEKIKISQPFKNILIRADISREEVALVEESKFRFPGIHINVHPLRNYIYKDLASHVLGYLGEITREKLNGLRGSDYVMGDLIGKDGLEFIYESHLRGKKGFKEIEVDVSGRELKTLRRLFPKSGNQLVLTLDVRVQKVMEELMTGTPDRPMNGSAIVMNLKTGEIIAAVSKPSFDPNLFAAGISRKNWQKLIFDEEHPLQNKVVDGQYPPGSTYKIVPALAALEEKIITPDETIHCPGYFKLGKRKYRCWKKKGHGSMNVYDALVQSCDVFFYTVGHRLGIDTLARYARKLGLGDFTKVNLTGEKPGLAPDKDWKLKTKKEPWFPGETISASIGQGFNLVTPIQQVNLISTIAGNGTQVKPFVVKRIEDHEGRVLKVFSKKIVKKVDVKPENLALIQKALLGVVNDLRGTGRRARLQKVEVAGKTGTAQVVGMKPGARPDKNAEVPYMFRDHAWFISYAPYKDPEIAVAVIIEHGGHGGHTAAPIAKKLIQAYDKYYKLSES